jgi:hypothetical protein
MAPQASLPASGRDGEIPDPARPLSESAMEWWNAMWTSPVATKWHPVIDVPALTRLGWLYDVMNATAEMEVELPSTAMAEVRQLEDRFGLTPQARMKLRWEIVDDDGAGSGAKKPKPRQLRAV